MDRRILRIHIKDRKGMYPEQFCLLRKGDIIKNVRSGVEREILSVSSTTRNPDITIFITMKKIRHPYMYQDTTTYDASSAGDFLPVKVKNRRIWKLDREAVLAQRRKVFKAYKEKKIKQLKKQLDALMVYN